MNIVTEAVTIGNHVNLGQCTIITALIHNFNDTNKRIDEQGVSVKPIVIEDDVMVGSTLYIDFETDEELDEWLENEPYVKNNVWNMDEFQIVPMKLLPKN